MSAEGVGQAVLKACSELGASGVPNDTVDFRLRAQVHFLDENNAPVRVFRALVTWED